MKVKILHLILEIIELNKAAIEAESCQHSHVLWSFLRSQRAAPLILHSGFVYRCERQINKRTYWLCIRYKGHRCNGRLILNGNSILKATEHNHILDDRARETNVELKSLEDDDVSEWIKGNDPTRAKGQKHKDKTENI